MKKKLYCSFIVCLFMFLVFNVAHATRDKFSEQVYGAITLKANKFDIDENVMINICEESCDMAENAKSRTKPLYLCMKDYAIYLWLNSIDDTEADRIKSMKDFSALKRNIAKGINVLNVRKFNELYEYLKKECRVLIQDNWRTANERADEMARIAKKQENEFISIGLWIPAPEVEVVIATLLEWYPVEDIMEVFLFYKNTLDDLLFDRVGEFLTSYYFMVRYPAVRLEKSEKKEYKRITNLVDRSYEVFSRENIITTAPKEPTLVVGDIHGNLFSVDNCIKVIKDELSSGHVNSIIFLGDYIDRGFHSLEVVERVLQLKLDFPNKIFLLRGNHENDKADPNTFVAELNKNFGLEYGFRLCYLFYDKLFQVLPVAAQISLDDGKKVFCAHAGFPDPFNDEDMKLFSELKKMTTKAVADRCEFKAILKSIMWNDPMRSDTLQNVRGNFVFSKEQLESFLNIVGCEYLVRGHEFFMTGFSREFDGLCYTIFSSANYCENNCGMIAQISSDGIRPFAKILKNDIEMLV